MAKPFRCRSSFEAPDLTVDIGIVGGGINGLCCAWHLAEKGHRVRLYEKDSIMNATSRASTKLLHGGLRYLETGDLRLVRESLGEREFWLRHVPDHARPLRIVIPVYCGARRSAWKIGVGLWLYELLARGSSLQKPRKLSATEVCAHDSQLDRNGLLCGYEFFDGQMDDHALGMWVADQARELGAEILEHCEVRAVTAEGRVTTAHNVSQHDRVINATGPWVDELSARSALSMPYRLDLIRGSHLVLDQDCAQAYLLEKPGERRIFFVLPWKGRTLVGTTEVRQKIADLVTCTKQEEDYLLTAYGRYFPGSQPQVIERFAGLRPLIDSAGDPSKVTREYAIHRTDRLITVFGGKWTTARALARKVERVLH